MTGSPAPLNIDPRTRPCQCFGAPICSVWRMQNQGWNKRLIGYECTACGHRWPRPIGSDRIGHSADKAVRRSERGRG